jgi:hypothetical protein
MLVEIGLIVLAFPLGYWISWMARDELVYGRFYFLVLIIACAVLGIFSFVYEKEVWGYSLFFILVFTIPGYWKSFDKKWTKRRV